MNHSPSGQTNWPRFYAAEVSDAITAQTRDGSIVHAGHGTAKIYRPKQDTTATDYLLAAIPKTSDPDILPVFRHDFGPEIAPGTRGYVLEDGWGVLWWLDLDTTLIRFTLTEDLDSSSFATATATINSDGSDNEDEITVKSWANNPSKSGSKGIAWKQTKLDAGAPVHTYWIVEIESDVHLVRFTLTSNLEDESIADATIDSTGPDNGDVIEVRRWSVATEGKIGDRGIAWKNGDTYWILELAQTTQLIRFTLDGNLLDESFQDATINSAGPDDGTPIEVRRWSLATEGRTGDKGIAWKNGDTYWIIELGTRVITLVTFTASTTPAFGTYNTAQTFDATITAAHDLDLVGTTVSMSTIGRTRVKAGMRGAAVKIGDIFVVVELQQPAAIIRGTLPADLLPANATTSVTVTNTTTQFPNDVPASGTITVDNPLQLRGFAGSKVVLQYDANEDKYFISSLTTFADRLVGKITSTFDSAADEIDLNTLQGLNGVLSPELVTAGSVAVQNTHAWDGKEDGRARAEYNWTTEKWELYQIDCAEDQGSPPGGGIDPVPV